MEGDRGDGVRKGLLVGGEFVSDVVLFVKGSNEVISSFPSGTEVIICKPLGLFFSGCIAVCRVDDSHDILVDDCTGDRFFFGTCKVGTHFKKNRPTVRVNVSLRQPLSVEFLKNFDKTANPFLVVLTGIVFGIYVNVDEALPCNFWLVRRIDISATILREQLDMICFLYDIIKH